MLDTPIPTETYRRCVRCVMDSSDPDIEFDSEGVCQYCKKFLERLENEVYDQKAPHKLTELVARIKASGKGKPYDCIIGVSGGVDSSYVAWLVKQQGLRPLAIHLDNGWNSELAVDNIHAILNALQLDLYTHVIDWQEFRDLQLSFIKAGVTNIEVTTDHAINAILQQQAAKHNIKYIITGGNVVGEGIYPKSWGWNNLDYRHIVAIHRRFGSIKLKTYPRLSLLKYLYNVLIRGIKITPILNYVTYDKPKAKDVLISELGWRPYPGKHYESVWTRFYQGYILPRKFKVDKRIAHFSSLVVAGTLSRDDAIAELAKDPYEGSELQADMTFVLKKFGFSEAEFEEVMNAPVKSHRDYPTSAWLFERMPQLVRAAKKLATRM